MDLEDLRPDAVVGRVAIPLFNCNGLKKYILKDAELNGIGKTLVWNVQLSIFRCFLISICILNLRCNRTVMDSYHYLKIFFLPNMRTVSAIRIRYFQINKIYRASSFDMLQEMVS